MTLTAQKIYDYLDRRVVGQEHAKRTLAAAGFLHILKTLYWIQTLAEYLNMPYLEINTRALSKTGYVGSSINDYFETFFSAHPKEEDRARALHGIVFLDEFDKICQYSSDSKWELQLQHSLLKVLEGGVLDISSKFKRGRINTKNMLFILGGNFENLRIKPKAIGFHEPEEDK
jgi:ATP-dependent Clp protease ATP-binding subunit ClpX